MMTISDAIDRADTLIPRGRGKTTLMTSEEITEAFALYIPFEFETTHVAVAYGRCGGENAEDYEDDIEEVENHPHYFDSFDDPSDVTYRIFLFSIDQEKINELL